MVSAQPTENDVRDRSEGQVTDDSAPAHRGNAARSTVVRSALTRNPFARLDGRSAEGRRARDLYRSYAHQLGGNLDAGTAALLLAAVEALLIAERVRADYLAGRASHDDVIRGEGASNRALRRLGLNKPPKRSSAVRAADFQTEMLRLAQDAVQAPAAASPSAPPAEPAAQQPDDEAPASGHGRNVAVAT